MHFLLMCPNAHHCCRALGSIQSQLTLDLKCKSQNAPELQSLCQKYCINSSRTAAFALLHPLPECVREAEPVKAIRQLWWKPVIHSHPWPPPSAVNRRDAARSGSLQRENASHAKKVKPAAQQRAHAGVGWKTRLCASLCAPVCRAGQAAASRPSTVLWFMQFTPPTPTYLPWYLKARLLWYTAVGGCSMWHMIQSHLFAFCRLLNDVTHDCSWISHQGHGCN